MRLILSRRGFVLGACAASVAAAVPAVADARPALHVLRDPNCGCCSAWVEIVQADGFDGDGRREHGNGARPLQARQRDPARDGFMPHRQDRGLHDRRSCSARRYPAVAWRSARTPSGSPFRGMPYGSPGMGPESEREAYVVYLLRHDGTDRTVLELSGSLSSERLPRCAVTVALWASPPEVIPCQSWDAHRGCSSSTTKGCACRRAPCRCG